MIAEIPFFYIFLKGQPHEKLTNVATYDWEGFSKVMLSANDIQRKVIADIAFEQWLESQGKENEFWKCVYHAM
ncbi:hypothetical protein DA100_06850 [Vibrio sp. Hep-1b-8]|nr:hypothetical protein DA100_06850 [Vibrio sp. Hep-1b-8]